jgi:hypothetical protein
VAGRLLQLGTKAMQNDPYGPTVRGGPGAAAGPSARALSPGQRWGKFLIEKRLGGGGQAEVFQAFDQVGTAGHVALKVPTSHVPPQHVQIWIETEAGALLKLEHSNIVHVLDAGLIHGMPYVATPLVEGLTMREHVQANPPSVRQTIDWTLQLADALHSAHSRGIVHRDVKPRNVLITTDGKPMLIDFGVASLISPYQPEARHDIAGTYPFMAPEQVRGDARADHRVDVFGLGGILKFLLVGEGPYDGAESTPVAVKEGRITPISDTDGPAASRALRRIANRALDADPAKRYQSTRAMARALRRVGARRRLLAFAGACVLLGVAVVALHRLGFIFGPAEGPDGPAARAAGALQAVEANLEIHLQRRGDVGSYRKLTADDLPLRSGDRIQIHAKLGRPLWAYVIAVSTEGGARVVYPRGRIAHGPVTEVHVPAGRDEWFEISPPAGTETIMLLARRQPLDDPRAFSERLLALASPPTVEGTGLYLIDQQGPRLERSVLLRQLSERPVMVEKGFLDLLQQGVPERWDVVRVLAFPQAPADSHQR